MELVQLGIEAVVLAFHVGMHTFRKASCLATSKGSWAFTVAGFTERDFEGSIKTYCTDLVH